METSPFRSLSPKPAACPPGAPSQPAVPGQGHVAFVYRWGFSNTAGS